MLDIILNQKKLTPQTSGIEEIQKEKIDEPKRVSLLPTSSDFIGWISESFNKTDDDMQTLNRNIGKAIEEIRSVSTEIKNIPSLQLQIEDLKLELADKNKEAAALEELLEEETFKKNLLVEAFKHISEEDLFSLIEDALIISVKSLRDGGEASFDEVKAKISDLQTKIDETLEKVS